LVSAHVSPVDNYQGDTNSVFDNYFQLNTSKPADASDGLDVNSSEYVEQDNNKIGFLDINVNDNTVPAMEDGDISSIFNDNNNNDAVMGDDAEDTLGIFDDSTTDPSLEVEEGEGVLDNNNNNKFNNLLDDADTSINNDNSGSDNSGSDQEEEEDESSDMEQTVVNSNDE
jgi:hypothetical protein